MTILHACSSLASRDARFVQALPLVHADAPRPGAMLCRPRMPCLASISNGGAVTAPRPLLLLPHVRSGSRCRSCLA
ncbi:hypothetical protein XOCgx_0539 [Xanthomonas oryzae pv. oryzicola]|nr:hypothetical protein XOCgx_0539 [Xanthomonas oryzae pv. oryzicola]